MILRVYRVVVAVEILRLFGGGTGKEAIDWGRIGEPGREASSSRQNSRGTRIRTVVPLPSEEVTSSLPPIRRIIVSQIDIPNPAPFAKGFLCDATTAMISSPGLSREREREMKRLTLERME